MTPPDSGERCTWNGYTDNNLSGQCSLRRGHDGPHEIARPDSGEREVPHQPWCQSRDGGPFPCNCRETHMIALPLSLAQRILAALESHPDLARELRAVMPKGTR